MQLISFFYLLTMNKGMSNVSYFVTASWLCANNSQGAFLTCSIIFCKAKPLWSVLGTVTMPWIRSSVRVDRIRIGLNSPFNRRPFGARRRYVNTTWQPRQLSSCSSSSLFLSPAFSLAHFTSISFLFRFKVRRSFKIVDEPGKLYISK